MPIYTKTGDKGKTSTFDGQRVNKYDLRVNTYGSFDECCAVVSLAQKMAKDSDVKDYLGWIQEHLFRLNAEIATYSDTKKLASKNQNISEADVQYLEKIVDRYTSELPKLDVFILPGTSLAGAQLHVARTVARRAERLLAELSESVETRPEVKQFVNRLSDCLYILARKEDQVQKNEELVDKIIKRYLEAAKTISNNEEGDELSDKYDRMREHTFRVITACVEKAKEIKVPMCIALVDRHGGLFGYYRMTGSLLVSEKLAQKKAYSAIAMQTDTGALSTITQPGEELYMLEAVSDNDIVSFGGGLLVKDKQGNIVAAVGCSGGTVAEDSSVALAGRQEIEKILEEK